MANLIQIKRSLTTAAPVALANGEQAFTSNGDVLYIGANGVVVPIGGKRNPGVLTANQALVANSTSYIDVVKTANLFIGTSSVDAINAVANVTHLGANANNELPTTWAVKTYVDSSIAYTITNNSSNTQLLFNDSGIVAGDAGITYNKTTDTLSVAGTLAVNNNITANGSGITVAGYVNATAAVNASMLAVGTNFIANTTGAYHTGTVNAQSFTVGSNIIANTAGVFTSGTVNGSIVSVGSAVVANALGVFTTGTVNGSVLSVGSAVIANGTGVYTTGLVNAVSYNIGTEFVANTNGVFTDGQVNAVSHTVGTDFVANSAGVYTVGTVNGSVVSVGSSFIANSTGAYHTGTVNATSVTVGSSVIANASGLFTTGQVNATSLTVDSYFVANSTTVLANADLTVTGNTVLGSSSADVVAINGEVNTSIIPAANVTYNLGSTGDRWNYVYAANVHSAQGYFEGNVQIVGDLIVSGNVTTQNVSSLEVQDPLIYLAGNNYASDLVDIGFVGNYYDGVNQRHAGLVRHAADDQFYLFHRYLLEPDNNVIHVDWSNTDFTVATLNTFLKSGALTSNSSAVTITANSTVEVNITANSITLATPLAATSGGTGYNTYTSGDLLVANTGNTLSKLGLGADGKILQSNGTALVYADLDGGAF